MSSDSSVVTSEFDADPARLVDIRRIVEKASRKTSLTPEQVDDFLTAVDEAAANAICHASANGTPSRFTVVCSVNADGLTVSVQDNGMGFTAPLSTTPMPAPDAPGGRGLPLMCALSDSVEITSTARGTKVTLKKSSAAV